jgi:hypothetical protein
MPRASARDAKVLCLHCQQYMSRTRERAHRVKHHAPLYSPPSRPPSKLRRVFDIEPDPKPAAQGTSVNLNDDQLYSDFGIATAINEVETTIRDHWTHLPDHDDESGGSETPDADDSEDLFDYDEFGGAELGLTVWDQLGEGYEKDSAKICKFTTLLLCYIWLNNLSQ